MKTFISLLVFFLFIQTSAKAQFISPNSSKNWNLDSLVANSGGVVTKTGNIYRISQNVTIETSDTLKCFQNAVVEVDSGRDIRIFGTLLINPPDSLVIKARVSGKNFRGLEINNSPLSSLRKLKIYEGGGLRLLYANILVDSCRFLFNNTAVNSNALNLFQSSPTIRDCYFFRNVGSAIGGGANIQNGPKIIRCKMIENVSGNTNRPQINLGASTADSILIIDTEITGLYTMAGGIGIFPIGSSFFRIENCQIKNNRYGIVCQNGTNRGVIRNNLIENNNIQNNPNLGGSGINFNGSPISVIVQGNTIRGNLWGITIQNLAKPNIGRLSPDTSNIGLNIFSNNGNGGQTYHIYNNTPDTIFAQNNDFGVYDSLNVEATLFHKPDLASLGVLIYAPWRTQPLSTPLDPLIPNLIQVYPNPASTEIMVRPIPSNRLINLLSMDGRVWQLRVDDLGKAEIHELPEGLYLVKTLESTSKLMIRR
jgi:parallel beta-helix repeat protein